MLRETWTADDLLLDGYYSFKLGAILGRSSGRLKGGLGILISASLRVEPKLLSSVSQMALTLSLDLGSVFLLLINVYLPPLQRRDEVSVAWIELEQYIKDLFLGYPKAMVILGGDFKARMGPDDTT